MSGIVGLLFLDGRSVDPADLTRMVASIAHRGPDNTGSWHQGPVGLGHCMLWTTPESLQERVPLIGGGGNLVLTADARIDNRDELLAVLDFGERPSSEIADSEFILASYEKWGESCIEHLLGDFAFAIWDGRKQHLFCARDHFGIKPFYYFHSKNLFVFGSEVKALLCLPEVPQRLNELTLGYHLAATVEDNSLTWYQDIVRLLPAQCMTVSRTHIRHRTYWEPDLGKETRLDSDEAYAEAFREIFTEAVRCRLRSAYPVGSELSGGLDSSSVTCVARSLLAQNGGHKLHTFSAVYNDTPQSDERIFMNPVITQGGVEAHQVLMDNISPLVDMERVSWHVDEPFTSPTVYIPWETCRRVQEHGVRVLLTGLDGDTTVSHGYGRLLDMAQAGEWDAFAAQVKAVAHLPNLPNQPLILHQYALPQLAELARRGRWLAFAKAASRLSLHFDLPRGYLYRNYWLKVITPQFLLRTRRKLRGRPQPELQEYPLISKDFAQRADLTNQFEAIAMQHRASPKTSRESHGLALVSPIMPYMFEWSNRVATAFHIEPRHPFADKRLVEFCLALPPEQKLEQGWTRMVLRRAMDGILPTEVQWRNGKTVNSSAFTHSFWQSEGRRLKEVIENSDELATYANMNVLRDAYHRYRDGEATDDDILRVWQAFTLALWLRDNDLESL